jgi:hypothetical protein
MIAVLSPFHLQLIRKDRQVIVVPEDAVEAVTGGRLEVDLQRGWIGIASDRELNAIAQPDVGRHLRNASGREEKRKGNSGTHIYSLDTPAG